MLIIEMKFLTGRFNTTPWGRNVNEGVPEWPPSPYRLLRALYDVWKRKCPEISETNIENIFKTITTKPPKFHLPIATASHTRAYLSENKVDSSKKQKIFDAFVVIPKETPVYFIWKNVWENSAPDQQIMNDLDELLKNLNYFGRSEAWVKTGLIKDLPSHITPNCKPLTDSQSSDDFEIVKVACPSTFDEYEKIPTDYKTKAKVRGQNEEPKESSWLEAFTWSTEDIHKKKLSNPPAMRFEPYLRKRDCFEPKSGFESIKAISEYNAVLFALDSKLLPSVEDTIIVAERFRRILMGTNKRIYGENNIFPKFSGKDVNGKALQQNHEHIYVLPFDKKISTGKINHIFVYSNTNFTYDELRVLTNINRITFYNEETYPIHSIPISFSTYEELAKSLFKQHSNCYVSATPFIPTHYWRKSRGEIVSWLKNEINRELENHNLPKAVNTVPITNDRGHFVIKPYNDKPCFLFKRSRKNEKPSIGYSFEITFDEPIPTPFAIGKYAHFGMGMFTPKQ